MFGEINDKQAEYLGDILESGRHLLSLINDILDLSKIEAGRMELEPTDFDLADRHREHADPGARAGAPTRHHARRARSTSALGMIRADERKVKQVLLNLLSNALKFTPEGGRIDVAAAVHDGEAEISVTDTGVGIAPEDQAAVFEEFRQVGTAAKKDRRHRARPRHLTQVHRAPWRKDPGKEPTGNWLDLRLHVATGDRPTPLVH